MKSLCNFALSGLRVATLLGLLVCGVQSVANAGVLSYTAGTGGTFDPSTVSTFSGADAFTQWDVSALNGVTSYTKVRAQFAWNGTGPMPASAFDLSSISLADPSTTAAFQDVQFAPTTLAYDTTAFTGDILETNQRTLSTPVTKDTLGSTLAGSTKLSFTIPTIVVNPGWNLLVRLQFSDAGGSNLNTTGWQNATYSNSSVPEPGTSAVAGGLVALAIFVQRRRAKRAANIDNNAV